MTAMPFASGRVGATELFEGARLVVVWQRRAALLLVPHHPAAPNQFHDFVPDRAGTVTVDIGDDEAVGRAALNAVKRCKAFSYARRDPYRKSSSAEVGQLPDRYLVWAIRRGRHALGEVAAPVISLPLDATPSMLTRAVSKALRASPGDGDRLGAGAAADRRVLRLAGVSGWTRFRPVALVGVTKFKHEAAVLAPMRRRGQGYISFRDETIRARGNSDAALSRAIRRALRYSAENMNVRREA